MVSAGLCLGEPKAGRRSRVVVLFSGPGPLPVRDTLLAAESVRLTAVRRMAPADRVRQAFELSEWARMLALTGLRQRHPACSELELVELLLGNRVVREVNPPTAK